MRNFKLKYLTLPAVKYEYTYFIHLFFVQLIQYTLSYSIPPLLLNINGKTIYRQIEMNKKERNSRRTKRNFIQIFAFQFIQVIYAMIYIKSKRVIQNSIIYHKNYVVILKYFSNKNIRIIFIFHQFHYYLSVFIY